MKIADVIKFENNDGAMVYRHPAEDFNTLSQLIVHETQEAILFRDGQALDLFKAGRHTLSTQNIPLLGKLVNLPFNGVSPFHCEVYFINRSVTLDLNWGVGNIDAIEPEFGLKITLGASGSFGFRVADSRKLLLELVGTEAVLTSDKFAHYFKDLVSMRVRRYLYELTTSFGYFALSVHQEELAQAVRESLATELLNYGVEVTNFYIGNIGANENDFAKLKEVRERKLEFNELGYNWVDEQIRDITLAYASNPGTADNIGSTMAQLPLAISFGNMIAKKTEPYFDNMPFSGEPFALTPRPTQEGAGQINAHRDPAAARSIPDSACSTCGQPLPPQSKFCPQCGTAVNLACRKCGTPMNGSMKFCPECGTAR